MKNTIILISLVLFLTKNNKCDAQFYFNVTPGIQLNSGSFGWKINKFVPYISLQYMSASFNYSISGKEYNNQTGQFGPYTNSNKIIVNAFLPTIGSKYFIKETNKIKAFANISLSSLIVSENYKNSQNPNSNGPLHDEINNGRAFATQSGFGVEYFFDENFSIGGEFGLRFMYYHYENSESAIEYNSATGQDESFTQTTKITNSLNPTYGKLSLNFYFNKKQK